MSAGARPFDAGLASLLEESWSVDWQDIGARDPDRLPYLLAARFDYDVKRGGFAQLIYNMRGACLGEIEDMLIAAGAVLAQEYYVRAIRICLGDKPEYRRFLASSYTDANTVKNDLQILSVEYLKKNVDFLDEASVFLTQGLAH